MPYKDRQAYNDWQREYMRRRATTDRQAEAALEEQIIELVRTEPKQHSAYSLYEHFRPQGVPVRLVTRALNSLLKACVLARDWRTLGLVLHESYAKVATPQDNDH